MTLENLYALNKLLKQLDVEVIQALSGAEALNLTLEHGFCVAIVDIQMPEMDGYELVELFAATKIPATLPAIFVSAIYSDEYHHRKGYEAGAVDFMSKPFVPEICSAKSKPSWTCINNAKSWKTKSNNAGRPKRRCKKPT